jgi:pimeloyl-ACP methyl ester carboxylesterase
MRADHEVSTARIASGDIRYLRAGAGTPLVLLHTLRMQLEYFNGLLEALDTTRLDVIVPDLPGHGRSSAPRVDYTARYFTDAIEELLENWGVTDAVVSGDSIGGSIALELAARHNERVTRVVAINPYDYGQWGGARRSSTLGNLVFTTVLWPGLGPIVARAGTRSIMRRLLEGGLHDRRVLPGELVDDLVRCGSLRGHAQAFRSLNRNWRTWILARKHFPAITVPVTLVYGDDDWSRPPERDADEQAIPGARRATLHACGHFASLEKPVDVARLIEATAWADKPALENEE